VTSLQPIHYTAVVYFLAAVVLNVIYDFNSGLTLVLSYDYGRPMVMIMIMAALWNRAGHYIFALWFLSFFLLSSFFSSPNLSGRGLDVYHTSAHGVALVRI